MSLVALAVRIATVRALTDATLAGSRVYDSAIDPIDHTITEERAPVIVVLTDDDEQEPEGRDLSNAPRKLDLVIEVAVASRVCGEDQDGQQAEAIEIPHTDAGLELTINLIGRQINRVLLTDQGPWATLWRRIVLSPQKVTSKRGAGSEKGVRFAARQLVITTETLSEPGFGAPANGFWADFLAALETDSDAGLRSLATLIRGEIELPALPEWRQWIAEIGANPVTAEMIGIMPEPLAGFTAAIDGGEVPLDPQSVSDVIGPDPNA
jgi:hypothetical protein